MMHPLDRPVWSALTTRQAALALGDGRAVRLAPEYGLFAAAADASAEARASRRPFAARSPRRRWLSRRWSPRR